MTELWLPALGTALLHGLWQGVLVGAAVEAGARILGSSAARLRFAIAATGVLVLAVAFASTFALVLLGAHDALYAPPSAVPDAAPASAASPALLRALGLLWLAGAALAWARLGSAALAVRRLARQATTVRELRVWRTLRRARAQVGARRRVVLLESAALDSPIAIAVGWRRAAIVLPGGLGAVLGEEHRVAILAHELVHVQRRDFERGIALRAVAALVAFHPVAGLLMRRLAEAREEVCDDVVANACDALVYARALEKLERARPAHRRHFRLAPAATGTAKRILRVLRPAPDRTRRVRAVGVVACVIMMAAATAPAGRALHEGGRLVRTAFPLVSIQAKDPAGAFTLAIRAGRAVAATVEGVAVPLERLVQQGDTIRILAANGAAHVSVHMAAGGTGISWMARPPQRP